MTFRPVWAAAAFGVLAMTACGNPSGPKGPPALLAGLPRPLDAAEQGIVGAANEFTFSWFRRLHATVPRDSGVFVSPLSASMALGMAMLGAEGQTYDQMRATLGFGDATERQISEGYASLIALLRGLDRTTDFRIANSIWHRAELQPYPAFLDASKKYFDAGIRGLDFSDPASVKVINDWAKARTNGKITEIIREIDPNVVMFLINAIYFNASWRARFDPARTTDATFHAANGTTRPMRLMNQTEELLYRSTPQFQAVDLLYGNGAFSMTVVLPHHDVDLDELVAGLDESRWAEWTSAFQPMRLDLHLPKLRLEYERTLNEDLKALGMPNAFHGGFTRMVPGKDLFIEYVRQKTFVDVHEAGTEAAAVTVVAMPESGPQMRVDRPYLFAIRERFSGAVLFIGKIGGMPPA